jgi:hypothetical protein
MKVGVFAVLYQSLPFEHEDSLMSIDEGLQKGIDLLKSITFREEQAQMWWA